MKILHLATDEKFIDMALSSFERVYPGNNSLFIYGIDYKPYYVKYEIEKIITKKERYFGINNDTLNEFDIIVVHSLNPSFYNIICNIPFNIPVVWFGWGFDYYLLINDYESFLPLTKKEFSTIEENKLNLSKVISSYLKKLFLNKSIDKVLHRINYFAPVLETEYELVKSSKVWKAFPKYINWNYGSLEDDFVKGVDGWIDGSNILLGNSADPNNNHLDTFKKLSQVQLGKNKIITPLSYGNKDWKVEVLKEGERAFGNNFEPLISYMTIEEYLSILNTCSIVIMNHTRQQALGNILIMLYLGAKLYLNPKSPVYSYLKNNGLIVFDIDLIEDMPDTFFELLSKEQMNLNREYIKKIWARSVCDAKTRKLGEVVLG